MVPVRRLEVLQPRLAARAEVVVLEVRGLVSLVALALAQAVMPIIPGQGIKALQARKEGLS